MHTSAPSLDLDFLKVSVDKLHVARESASSLQFARENIVTKYLTNVFARASLTLGSFVDTFYPKINTATATSLSSVPDSTAKIDYSLLASAKLSTMEGFRGQYLAYGKAVFTSLGYYEHHLAGQLREYKNLLAGVVTNHQDRNRLTDLTDRYKQSKAFREESSHNAAFWEPGSFRAIQDVADVVERSADLPEIFDDGQKIVAKLKATNMDNIQVQVKEIRALVQLAVEAIDNKSLTLLSDAQLKNLSAGIFDLAESVEFYGLILYRANVYVSALERLSAVVKRLA